MSDPEPERASHPVPGPGGRPQVDIVTVGGLRVHIARPRGAPAQHGELLRLNYRHPRRRPPPDVEDDLPTPLEAEARRRPIAIDPLPPETQFRAVWTLLQVSRFVLRRLRLQLFGRLDDEVEAVLTRQLFERLSGMWIKVGQLLSLRADLISDPMCRELGNLQYQMRGFPPAVARQVIEEELGRPLSAVFADFAMEPFAAASIAQVHRATLLRDNRAVVVKVMRPDVERTFKRDFRLIASIIRVLAVLGIGRRLRLRDWMRELRAILDEEVDYQHEVVNLLRMRRNLRRHDIYVPRVIKRLSRRRILVIEEVDGVLMSDYIRLRRDDPDRVHRWAVLNGIDGEEVARRLSITVLRQILEDNEFHGDVHPGNIMLLADNGIALLDFGSVGRLHQRTWSLYRHSMAALAMRDYERAADYMLMLSPPPSARNFRILRRELAAVLDEWQFKA
ncbi:MAG: ABC1 kinase family protein, partial [Thiohalocapsa sp.]